VARELPLLAAGDLVAFRHAGAYGAVMSSTYNTRPLAAEIMVQGQDVAVVRPRQDVAALIAQDRLPSWLNDRQG
jgi:diaminopimelate decarboxylase